MSGYRKAEAKAWRAFSRMIRTRDEVDGFFTCPTCGRTLPIEQADAGHYISRVKKAVKFDELNVHAQCLKCIRFGKSNRFIYRKWLVEKYGGAAVADLELKAEIGVGYNTESFLMLAAYYKRQTEKIKIGSVYIGGRK
jgi:4-hydroxy-3-methylbut-2-en-1-yl diphosphate synthase IspG/GcpE